MSDWVMDIARYVNTQFEELKMMSEGAGANVFVNDMPATPDFAVAFFRYGGGAPSETFSEPFLIRNPRLQVMVRDPYSERSIDWSERIMKIIGSIKEQQIGGTFFHRVKPVGELTELGPDSTKRERATTNYDVSFRGE